jgi:hypothetical protein
MTFGDAKIDGDKATVSVTNPAKGKEPFEFPLVKEGGEWKVDFSMSTLMKMGMNQAGQLTIFHLQMAIKLTAPETILIWTSCPAWIH